ncbi:MAG: DNA translocase FtsK 4TM domain-containing protein [Candidatus Doudnabacteria bacterium]|nr:DNA translocase FtsK 4TM domain-containing protein [Candidatus Doudnabacteria bacterium]
MSRRRRNKNRNRGAEELPKLELSPQTKRGVLVVGFLLLAILAFLAMFDAAGALGNIIAKILRLLFGWAAIVSPLIFLGMAIALLLAGRRKVQEEPPPVSNLRVYLGSILFVFSLTGLFHLIVIRGQPELTFELVKAGEGGGYLGALASFPLYSLLDFWAALVIFVGLVLVSLVVTFNLNLASLFRRSKEFLPSIKEKPLSSDVKINQMPSTQFSILKVSQSGGEIKSEGGGEKEEMAEDETLSIAEESIKPRRAYEVSSRYRKDTWQLPPINLLEDSHNTVDSGNIEANIAIIQKTLSDFGIEVEMGEVNVGPTVTQYTLRPAQGIKLSQIVTLQNDLALALAAPSIRIEAPIPGRSLVGIEIPNKATAIVRLKDIVSTAEFINHKSNLAFGLGRDVSGSAIVADLAKMPHLLIAGATGTGKSVCINSILISFMYRNSPEELRLIIIDPKRVELNLYNGIPHLLTPVVTDYEKAVNALKWAVKEMDRRYSLLAQTSKRNIIEYNAAAAERLPYIVIIVDELADLMAVAQADVEAAVVRLAQMARAVGVHLILATQRPSVDIITGLIKANITARIAFAVASQVDSRTILDVAGAEKLLGAGDMLYVTAELGKPKRIQGTYISEREVRVAVDFVNKQAGDVEYSEEILEKQKVGPVLPGFEEEDVDDDMLSQAVEVVRQAGKASASLLQRRLRIGYARAARLLDLMEEKGIIGPADGAKPRDVFIDHGYTNDEII